MNFGRMVDNFIKHEGRVFKEGYHKPYKDSVGKLTIGYGRNITDRGITEDEALLLLHNDIQQTVNELRKKYYWFDSLDEVRQEVIVNMAFNMGVPTFSQFVNTISYIEEGKFDLAAANMLKSKWSRQVGIRATELAREMASGLPDEGKA